MKPTIEYRVNHELKINQDIIKGRFTLEEILQHRWTELKKADYNDSYNMLVDIREAELIDFLQRMEEFVSFVKEVSIDKNMKRKCAFLTSKPIDVVLAEVSKLYLKNLDTGIKIETFSTEEAAIDWLTY